MIGRFSDFLSKHWKAPVLALAMFGLTVWLFWPATGYDFLNFDDDRYILANPFVQQGLTMDSVRWACKAIHESYWLPVLWISYMIDASVFGIEPFGYHLTNILLHAANAAILFLLLNAWTKRTWLSLFISMFFAWHPLRVESVAWITERKDVLSGFFFLLCLAMYKSFARKPIPGRDLPIAIVMALGLMTKPALVTLPFLMLLLDYWPLARWRLETTDVRQKWSGLVGEKTLFWALAAIFSFITYYTQNISGSVIAATNIPWFQRIAAVPAAYTFYLSKTFWPGSLQVVYEELAIAPGSVAVALTVLCGITALAILAGWRRKAAPVGWFWFLGMLVPVIGFVRVGTVHVADRFTYLPAIGLGLMLAYGFDALAASVKRLRLVSAGAATAVSIVCLVWTRTELPKWKDSLTVFGHVLKSAPRNHVANSNYATALLMRGQVREALQYFEKAADGNPRYTQAAANVGRCLVMLNRTDEAMELLQRALETQNAECPFLNCAMGIALLERGEADSAVPYLRKAVAWHPESSGWRMEVVRALVEAGRFEEADEEFKAIQDQGYRGPSGIQGLAAYYMGLRHRGEKTRVWRFLTQALAVDPDNAFLLNNAAWIAATDPESPVSPEQALRMALKAVELSDDSQPSMLDTLAASHAACGNMEEAIRHAGEAVSKARAAGSEKLAARIERRLEAYRQGIRWVDQPGD